MAKPNEPKTVMLVSENQELVRQVRASLDKAHDFRFVVADLTLDDMDGMVQIHQPEIILLDFEYHKESIYDQIETLVTNYPSRPIVAILGQDDIQNSNSVVLAGARAFVVHPFTEEVMVNTLTKVRELSARLGVKPAAASVAASSTEQQKHATFVVFSPKGGVGTTSTAANLAISAHKELKTDVLLMDGKHQFGHISLALNIRTANSIVDLISHAGNLDEGLIKQVTVRHESGIEVLPAPNALSEAQGIRPNDLFKVFSVLQKTYSVIIVDAGNYLDENTVTFMDASTHILLVLNPDIASLRDARKFMDIARNLSYPKEKLHLILNKTGKKSDMNISEIERVLKVKMLGSIPTDDNQMALCMNEGTPIVIKRAHHPISRAYLRIAGELSALLKKPRAVKPGQSASESLDQSSRLG